MRRGRWDRDGWLARAGLTDEQVSTLATYNSEVHRGLLHTEAWQAQMAELQRRFDEARGNHPIT